MTQQGNLSALDYERVTQFSALNDELLKYKDANPASASAQIEQLVRISKELGREVANGEEARRIYRIGTQYNSTEETLAKLGMAPNRERGQLAVPIREVA